MSSPNSKASIIIERTKSSSYPNSRTETHVKIGKLLDRYTVKENKRGITTKNVKSTLRNPITGTTRHTEKTKKDKEAPGDMWGIIPVTYNKVDKNTEISGKGRKEKIEKSRKGAFGRYTKESEKETKRSFRL